MSLPRILIQLDSDPHPSVFDSVVAVDSSVDHLLRHGSVRPEQIRDVVYGAIFTRGSTELQNTAIFVGGADVAAGEELLQAVCDTFFGPMRVSVMLDANGANTTAAAAVVAAAKHVPLAGAGALVMAATGAVGQRCVELLARQGARVRVASRRHERARIVCDAVAGKVPGSDLIPVQISTGDEARTALEGISIVVAAGAPGAALTSLDVLTRGGSVHVAVDLNAVPPAGIEGIEPTDKEVEKQGVVSYGAIGVGGMKMKIHRAAIQRLFTRNDWVLDAPEIFKIGQELQQ